MTRSFVRCWSYGLISLVMTVQVMAQNSAQQQVAQPTQQTQQDWWKAHEKAWASLKKGMTISEVKKLLGPYDPNDRGWQMVELAGGLAAQFQSNGASSQSHSTYNGNGYTLEFVNGKLHSWAKA